MKPAEFSFIYTAKKRDLVRDHLIEIIKIFSILTITFSSF